MTRFRIWLESQTIEIPLANIVASKKAVVQAFQNFKDGRESRTFGPVEVWQIDDDNYQLLDGYHRFIAAIVGKNKTIKSEVVGQGPSEYWSLTQPSDRFRYTPTMAYKDLEHLENDELLADLGL